MRLEGVRGEEFGGARIPAVPRASADHQHRVGVGAWRFQEAQRLAKPSREAPARRDAGDECSQRGGKGGGIRRVAARANAATARVAPEAVASCTELDLHDRSNNFRTCASGQGVRDPPVDADHRLVGDH